jgi:Protein of unknown function (DUF1501)
MVLQIDLENIAGSAVQCLEVSFGLGCFIATSGWPTRASRAAGGLGYAAAHDLHATLLDRFGIGHTRFTKKFQGIDYKLTGVEPAKVVGKIIA